MNDLRQYVNFFPSTGLGEVLNSYLESEISPFPLSDIENQEDGVSLEAGEIDSLQILSAMSVLTHYPLSLFESDLWVGRTRESQLLRSLSSTNGRILFVRQRL